MRPIRKSTRDSPAAGWVSSFVKCVLLAKGIVVVDFTGSPDDLGILPADIREGFHAVRFLRQSDELILAGSHCWAIAERARMPELAVARGICANPRAGASWTLLGFRSIVPSGVPMDFAGIAASGGNACYRVGTKRCSRMKNSG
jgi:hypothetical protein